MNSCDGKRNKTKQNKISFLTFPYYFFTKNGCLDTWWQTRLITKIKSTNQLGITVSSDHISRSHRIGKRGRTPRPIIVRLVHHNMKIQLLRKRRELKAQETNFDIREDLTQCRRDILH